MERSAIDIVTDPAADLLSVALACHELGWCVLATKPGTKQPKGQWKRYQRERPTIATLRRWFRNPDGIGLAVMLGAVSGGLVCRDFDSMTSFERWAARYPDYAQTLPTVATGRPGRHLYAIADNQQIQRIGKAYVEFDDGEARLQNCICMLPPSKHPSGAVYRWLSFPSATIPKVDLRKAGFLQSFSDVTESTESTETTEEYRGQQKSTDAITSFEVCSDETSHTHPHPPPNGPAVLSVLLRRHDGLRDQIKTAIRESLPSRPGRRNRQVFELCRSLKAIPEIADVEGAELEKVVRAWHKKALPAIATKPFEETWIDFLRAWPRVKYPRGQGRILEILKAAKQSVPVEAERFEQPALRLLVSLCRELQREAGPEPFPLACRTAGRLLEVDHMTASRWLYLLVQTGILTEVEKGSQRQNKATRYRYVGER